MATVKYINSLEDLLAINNDSDPNGGVGSAYIYTLTKDLDFNDDSCYDDVAHKTTWTTGSGWPCIAPNSQTWFQGEFDGAGFKIKNCYFNEKTSAGLFGAISGCNIHDLIIEDVNFNSVTAQTVVPNNIGALAGVLYGGEDTNTLARIAVRGGYVGGDDQVGGFIGALTENSSTITIDNCYVQGTTVAERHLTGYDTPANDDGQLGGFNGSWRTAGGTNTSVIRHCYAAAIKSSTSNDHTHGFVGVDYYTSLAVTSAYYDNSIWGTEDTPDYDGTVGKATSAMQAKSTFVSGGFDIEDYSASSAPGQTWTIVDGEDYPRLAMEWRQAKQATGAFIPFFG